MRIQLSKYASNLLAKLERHLQAEPSDVVEEAIINLYESLVSRGEIVEREESTLFESLSSSGLLKRTYKCKLKEKDSIQGSEFILEADSEEEAWQQMAIRFPDQANSGFIIQEVDPIDF